MPPQRDAHGRFLSGHESLAPITHGATVPEHVQPVADELMQHALDIAPWLKAPAFRPALQDWAWSEARYRLVAAWVHEHGLIHRQKGTPRPATQLMLQLQREARSARQTLGLDPKSYAALQRELIETDVGAAKVEELVRRGGEVRARRLAAATAERLAMDAAVEEVADDE